MKRRFGFGGSFRFRMVVFSTLVAAVGLLAFGLLSVSFYQRELKRGLEKDLRAALWRTAPALLRLTQESPNGDDRMLGRVLGRLEEFRAEYAIYREGAGWFESEGWPVPNETLLDPLVEGLPGGLSGARGRNRGEGGWRMAQPADGNVPDRRWESGRIRNLVAHHLPDDWLFVGLAGRGDAVLMAVPDGLYEPRIRRLVIVLVLVSPAALALVALCAWFFSSRAIAPIRQLSQLAARVTADDLSGRIPGDGRESEFRELIELFNGMLDRLEKSFGQARRFAQDAAHELNTPLTLLTGKVDEAVVRFADGSPEQQQMVEIGEELSRLREIVRKLHLLARIDGGGLRAERVEIDMSAVLADAVEEMRECFPGIVFSVDESQGLRFCTDPALFRQIVMNLLSNAARYNEPEGTVLVELLQTATGVELSVTNTGPEIPEEKRALIFDRFTRGDSSRPNEAGIGGLGLGLSLSREFARILGGDLILQCGDRGRVKFALVLPFWDPGRAARPTSC